MDHPSEPEVVSIVDRIGVWDSLQFDKSYQETSRKIRTVQFRDVIGAYAYNMDRQMATVALVINAVAWGALGGRSCGPIPFRTGLPINDVFLMFGPDGVTRFRHNLEILATALEDGGGQEKFQQNIINLGNTLVALYLNTDPEPGNNQMVPTDGVQSIFYGMILNSYAAFELLVGDLWIEAINLAPEHYKLDKGDKSQPTIKISDIERFNYDIRGRMGEFLKVTGREDFQSLKGIQDAYDCTFPKFLKQDPLLLKTAKLRHLIAHRGGLVDRRFHEDCVEHGWTEFTNIPIGDRLVFTGPQVSELISPCVRTSVRVIRALDSWGHRYVKRRNQAAASGGSSS